MQIFTFSSFPEEKKHGFIKKKNFEILFAKITYSYSRQQIFALHCCPRIRRKLNAREYLPDTVLNVFTGTRPYHSEYSNDI